MVLDRYSNNLPDSLKKGDVFMIEELTKGTVTLFVGMTVVFLVLGILYGMLLLMPLVNGNKPPEE
jgi:hypothetical protein